MKDRGQPREHRGTRGGDPTKQQVQDVIDTLRAYEERLQAEGEDLVLNFARGTVVRPGGCGTVACFAGHYEAARLMADPDGCWGFNTETGGHLECAPHSGRLRLNVTYHDGARSVARALGFEESGDLTAWADAHPEIWGNAHGAKMFDASGPLAFGDRIDEEDVAEHGLDGPFDTEWYNMNDPASELPMEMVLDHLEAVRDRLPA